MIALGRNQVGLTTAQIESCQEVWAVLCGSDRIELDVSDAARSGSKTRFNEERRKVFLGADALPGVGSDANSRMSTLACLAHEFAHVERHRLGYRRPTGRPDREPDVLLDEAETSLRAAFTLVIYPRDRCDLVEDARDRLIQWLALQQRENADASRD